MSRMTGAWFTDPNASGELLLTWREECWYVESPDPDSDVKCLLQGDIELNPDDSPRRLHGIVSKYIRGVGERPDYLYLRSKETANASDDDSESETSEPTSQSKSRTSNPESSSYSSTENTSVHRNKRGTADLDEIAENKIGDEEFTITQEDRESVVGKAKKRARNQQRDPAIDPKLQNDGENDE